MAHRTTVVALLMLFALTWPIVLVGCSNDSKTIYEVSLDTTAQGPDVPVMDFDLQEPEDDSFGDPLPDGESFSDSFMFGDLEPGVDANDSDEIAFQAALALYNTQQFLAAITAFEDFIAVYPFSARADNARYLIARCRFELAEYLVALELFGNFLLSDPESSFVDDATYYVGRSNYELGDFLQAIDYFAQLVALFPESLYVDNSYYFSGRSHFQLAAWSNAIGAFEEVIALPASSQHDGALYWAGRSAYAWAVADGVPTSPHLFEADTYFEGLFTDHPGSIYEDNGYYYYGLSAYRQEAFNEAISRLNVVRALFPGSVYEDNAWYFIGRSWYKLQEWLKASDEFAQFEVIFPDSSYADNAWYFDARSHYEMGRDSGLDSWYQGAVTRFDMVTTNFPASAYADNAWYYKLLSHVALGQCAAAVEDGAALQSDYPSSKYTPKAQNELANAC
jgi:TolA-binding protein